MSLRGALGVSRREFLVAIVLEPAGARSTEAFELLFAFLDPVERQGAAQRAQALAASGALQRDGLWVARQDNRLLGSILAQAAPGGLGLLWPPGVAVGRDNAATIEDALVSHSMHWLHSNGVKLCQCLLRPEEAKLAVPLLRNGFSQTTSLLFLRHWLGELPPQVAFLSQLEFVPFAADDKLAATLERTYEGTLDCPELNGLRTSAEILTGHRSQGTYDPKTWWLVHAEAQPIGILLINAIADEPGWEIIYLGLVPEARRQGYGYQLARKALTEAARGKVAFVDVAVDARNVPARKVYQQLGFTAQERRDVYLRVL